MPTTRSQGIATIEPAEGGSFLVCLSDGRVEHHGSAISAEAVPVWRAAFVFARLRRVCAVPALAHLPEPPGGGVGWCRCSS
jgi:hypothetical protein